MLLGNNLAGDKVVVNSLVTDTPLLDQAPDPIEQEIPDLYPSCAVTRAMAKKSILNNENKDVDLFDTIIGQSFNDQVNKTISHSMPKAQTDLSTSSQISPNHQGHDTMSRSRLIQEQQNDPDISYLFHRALSENETSHVPICYYTKNGVLMRKWRPPDVPANDEWKVTHQIVIPRSYRLHILSIAHETPMSGHLGVNKSYNKILNHFYWPGIKADVSR